MSVITDYIAPPVPTNQCIDPAKVLLIVNSSVALSAQVADYYKTARGLGNHRLSFALGTNAATVISSATRYQDIIVPVANYIAANNIEAVFCSAGVPARFNDGDNYGISTEAMLGAARKWQAAGGLGGTHYGTDMSFVNTGNDPAKNSAGGSYSTNAGVLYGGSPVTPDGNAYNVAMQFDPYWIKHSGKIIPWGRIGFPAYDGQATETFAETRRMIDDCIWAEQQPKGPRDYFAMIADYSGNGKHPWQWYAWQMMLAAGHNCKYAHETNTGINATEAAWFGKAHDIDWVAFKAGSVSVAADCYIGSIIRNLAVGNAYANSLAPKRGAWAFNWTSSGNRFVANLLNKGGAAGIGPAMEPYNVGMPDDGSVIAAALQGFSLSEINWLVSPASWAMTAWGDPLYRPFPSVGLADGEFLKITNITPARVTIHQYKPFAVSLSNHTRAISNITKYRGVTWRS